MIEENYSRASRTGLIYSIQRYSIHDGPGIRTTVFFKGCQFNCPWCANPESKSSDIEIGFIGHKCVMCGMCKEKCPEGAIQLERNPRIDREKCSLCGLCARYCPTGSYIIYGRQITSSELLEEVLRDQPFYRKSGGGVTVSGGDPTFQMDFLIEFLTLCRDAGIDTAIETHGYADENAFRRLFPIVNHFLIDIKHMDSRIHRKVIGCGNDKTLNNIRIAAAEPDTDLWLRIPVIPGFNDGNESIEAFISFAAELKAGGNLKVVNLLPYHGLWVSKLESLEKIAAPAEISPPDKNALEQIMGQFSAAGIPCAIGG